MTGEIALPSWPESVLHHRIHIKQNSSVNKMIDLSRTTTVFYTVLEQYN